MRTLVGKRQSIDIPRDTVRAIVEAGFAQLSDFIRECASKRPERPSVVIPLKTKLSTTYQNQHGLKKSRPTRGGE